MKKLLFVCGALVMLASCTKEAVCTKVDVGILVNTGIVPPAKLSVYQFKLCFSQPIEKSGVTLSGIVLRPDTSPEIFSVSGDIDETDNVVLNSEVIKMPGDSLIFTGIILTNRRYCDFNRPH